MKYFRLVGLFLIFIKGFSESINIVKDIEEKPFVILIASYNNEQYARESIKSVLNQRYSNYRVIFINDCSGDNTLEITQDAIKEFHGENRVIIIDNKTRKLGLRNYYEAIVKHTRDEEVVVCVDGDDFLGSEDVLSILNTVYSDPNREIWLTYGQFKCLSTNEWGWNRQIPEDVVRNNDFRAFFPRPTHLRTFYSWLFKKINVNDLLYQGLFFEMTWDLAFMFPMLEMCGKRFVYIENFMYLYNDLNPINDRKVNAPLQSFYTGYIMGMSKYKMLKHSIFNSCNDDDCIICNKNINHEIYEKNR